MPVLVGIWEYTPAALLTIANKLVKLILPILERIENLNRATPSTPLKAFKGFLQRPACKGLYTL